MSIIKLLNKKQNVKELKSKSLIIFVVFALFLCSFPMRITSVYAMDRENIEPVVIVSQSVENTGSGIVCEVKEAELTIEQKIDRACTKYNVPFSIALAIARLETGWFTSDAYLYRNNPGGLSRNEVPISFATIEDGVEAFVSNLYRNYISQGLTDPYEIGKKYCPVDSKWANKVETIMNYEG